MNVQEVWTYLTSQSYFGNTLGQYAIVLAIIMGGLVMNKVLHHILNVRLMSLAKRTATTLDDALVGALDRPVKMVVGIMSIYLVLQTLTFADAFEHVMGQALKVLVATTVAYTLMKLVDVGATWFAPRVEESSSRLDDQLLPLLQKSVKIFIGVVVTVMIVDNLGYSVTSIVAGLGIGGLALALGAQETLSNFFGSVAIFADRPFQVGDRVQVEGHDGPVESVGFRSTRVRTLDGHLVTIPNAKMANTVINNIAKRPFIKRVMNVTVTYDTSYENMQQAIQILRDIMAARTDLENSWVYFNDFGAHYLNILVIYWFVPPAYLDFLEAQQEINLEVLRQFNAAGIKFAFPTQVLHVEGPEPGLPVSVQLPQNV